MKPSNVVLGETSRLIDLGSARSLESAAQLRVPLGTDAFMAPELCASASTPGRVGPPTDVWGLGATLYYAATGGVPYPRPASARLSEDTEVRYPQLATAPAPMPDYVPRPLASVIARMLAVEPSERPSAADAADELAAL